MTPTLYGAAVGGLAIVGLSAALLVQTNRVKAKEETITGVEMQRDAWKADVVECEGVVEDLEQSITDQNEALEDAAEFGRLAEERQRTIDRLMAEAARAEDDLREVAAAYRELRHLARGQTTCQTYESVLRRLAEGGAP